MSSNGFFLRTFGTLTLQRLGDADQIGSPRRKSLALLALLAAHDEGVPRDRAASLLWPDADLQGSRHSLTQTLYVLRRELGIEEPVLGESVLRLNAEQIASDVAQFSAAIDVGELEVAVDVYSGPFLDAVYFRNCVDFERWAEERRAMYLKNFKYGISGLSRSADATGDVARATEYRRRAWDADPLDAEATLNFASGLEAAGQRLDALRILRAHEQLLAVDFDARPSEPLIRLQERLRASPILESIALGRESSPVPSVMRDAKDESTVPASNDDTLAPFDREPTSQARRVRPMTMITVAAGAVALVVLFLGRTGRLGTREALSHALPVMEWSGQLANADVRLVVFPFDVLRDTANEDAGRAVALMLGNAVDGAAGIRVVAPSRLSSDVNGDVPRDLENARHEAASLGADFYVVGQLARDGDQLDATASVYPVASTHGVPVTAHARAVSQQLVSLTPSLALQLLTTRSAGDAGHFAPSAARTAGSLEAFKAYLDGEREARRGHYGDAIAAYRRAVQVDSQFALAYYRMARAADWAGDGGTNVWATAKTRRLMHLLPDRERAVLAANSEWERGAVAEAERSLRRLLELYPDDPEAEYLLGEILYHTGFAVGRAAGDAMPMFQHVAAQEPANVEALAHLARLSARTGNVRRVDTLARRVAQLRAAGDRLALELEILARMSEGNRPALSRIMEKTDASRTRDDILYIATWRVAATTDSTELASAFGWRLLDRSTDPELRVRTRTRLAEYAVNAGRLTRALQIASGESISLLGFRAYLVSLPFAGATTATLLAYADSLDAWRPPAYEGAMTELALAANGASRRLVAFPRGLLAIRLGDLAGARRAQQELTREKGDTALAVLSRALGSTLAGEIARFEHDIGRAVAEFDKATAMVPMYTRLDAFGGLSLARFSRAEALFEAGRTDDAIKWYRTLDSDSGGELAFKAAAARGTARSANMLPRSSQVQR